MYSSLSSRTIKKQAANNNVDKRFFLLHNDFMKVTIYTISDCQFSKQEKEFLTKNNIQFEEKNLETNKDFLVEMLQISNNFAGTPVTKIEKDDGTSVVLKGFTAEELAKELGIQAPVENAVPQAEASVPPVVAAAPVAAAIDPEPAAQPAPMDMPPAAPIEPAVPEMPAPVEMPPVAPAPEPAMPEAPAIPETPALQPMDLPVTEPAAPPAAPVMPQTPSIDMAPPVPPAQAPIMQDVPEVAPAAPEPATPPAPMDMPSAAPAQPAAPASPAPDAALNDILNNLQQKVGDQNNG